MVSRLCVLLLGVVLASCKVDAGDVTLKVVKSWQPAQDPFLDAKTIRVRVDGPSLLVGPTEFPVKNGSGTLEQVPVGDDRRITVEGLGFEGNPISRGRTGPLTVPEGDLSISLFVGLIDKDAGAFSYTPVKQLITPRAFHTATLLSDGSVMVCGGISRPWRPERNESLPTPTTSMERIDGNSLLVQVASKSGCAPGTMGCMVSPRVGHTAMLLASGNVLVAGGTDGATLLDRVEIYSPEDNRFVRDAALKPRQWQMAVSVGNGALLVGGENTAGMNLPSELYTQGQVDVRPALRRGRRAFTLTALPDGTLVAAGGIDASGQLLDTIEILPPDAPSWSDTTRMEVPRAYHTATLLEDGTILFVGGLHSDAAVVESSIERLDPPHKTITTLSIHLSKGERWGHSATQLDDGRVLVVGGFTGNRFGEPSSTVEQISFFDGGAAQVRLLGNLKEARAGHSTTLLRSGMVLVLGGVSGAQVSQTAEIFVY